MSTRHRIAVLLIAMIAPITAHALTLQWPVACTLGQDCFLQNLVDHNTSGAAHDYACGSASYDTHNGTDIRLRNLAAMRAGVAVKAVADGTVLGVRDGVTDVSIREGGVEAVKGQECGNGVHLLHEGGHRTQYCHMKNGSITVANGQKVRAGDVIGMVGLSGKTEFPHLHLTVWRGKQVLDPFTSGPMEAPCAMAGASPVGLWATPVSYQQSALLNEGFATSPPDKNIMRDTPTTLAKLPADAPALLYWIDLMGIRANDVVELAITAPDGSTWAEKSTPMAKPLASYFAFIGKKNASGNLVKGSYKAHLTLMRTGKPVLKSEQAVVVE